MQTSAKQPLGCQAGASWLQASAGMSDADVGDSDVVADTYGVSAGQSRFSAGRNKRQKVDDAPTSASTLSEEQARVRDLVLAGKNVRPLLRLCAGARLRTLRWRVRAHSCLLPPALRLRQALGRTRDTDVQGHTCTGFLHRQRWRRQVLAHRAHHRPAARALRGGKNHLRAFRALCQLLSRLPSLCRSLARRWL